jgi:hypothetical protein
MSDPSSQPVINQVKGAKNVVAADTIEKVVIEAEKGRSYVPRMAPPISELLTGREGTIRVLVGKLWLRQKKTGSQQILALKGMGGIGKTTLAAALAHHPKVEKELPDGTLWVSLGPEPDLMSLLGNGVNSLVKILVVIHRLLHALAPSQVSSMRRKYLSLLTMFGEPKMQGFSLL